MWNGCLESGWRQVRTRLLFLPNLNHFNLPSTHFSMGTQDLLSGSLSNTFIVPTSLIIRTECKMHIFWNRNAKRAQAQHHRRLARKVHISNSNIESWPQKINLLNYICPYLEHDKKSLEHNKLAMILKRQIKIWWKKQNLSQFLLLCILPLESGWTNSSFWRKKVNFFQTQTLK